MSVSKRRVVLLYYGFQFFFSLLLWLPIFYEYQRRLGLDDNQIFSIQSIYYILFCLLEIPTGLLADRFGYRLCMIAGGATLLGANLFPIFAPSYSGFLLHFLFIALARSLVSGASSAYLYDFLKLRDSAVEYREIEGKARAYSLAGKVVLWSLVGTMMQWHFTLPYWITAGFGAVAAILAVALPRLPVEPRSENRPVALTSRLLALGTLLGRHPLLLLLMLQGIAIFVLERICQVNLFQPILGGKHFPLTSYGAIMSAMTVFEAVGSRYPLVFKRWLSDLNTVFVLTLVMATALAAIPWSGTIGTVVALSVFAAGAGLSFPVQRQLLNDAIPDSRYRATLLSVESLLDRAVCAWVASKLGGFLNHGKLDDVLITAALVTFVGMALVALAIRTRALPQNLEMVKL